MPSTFYKACYAEFTIDGSDKLCSWGGFYHSLQEAIVHIRSMYKGLSLHFELLEIIHLQPANVRRLDARTAFDGMVAIEHGILFVQKNTGAGYALKCSVRKSEDELDETIHCLIYDDNHDILFKTFPQKD